MSALKTATAGAESRPVAAMTCSLSLTSSVFRRTAVTAAVVAVALAAAANIASATIDPKAIDLYGMPPPHNLNTPRPTSSTNKAKKAKAEAAFSSSADCVFAVSNNHLKHNSECKELCESAVKDADFSTFDMDCIFEPWTKSKENDRVYVDGSCYNQWVYGYSDEGDEGTDALLAGFKTFDDVPSPAECQEKCQLEPDCVNFLWRGLRGEPTCVLKNQDQVDSAVEIQLKLDGTIWGTIPSDEVATYCNTGLDYKCNTLGHYECLKCDESGIPSCVWKSYHHLAGPKNCGVDLPLCGSKTTAFPPIPTAPDQPADDISEAVQQPPQEEEEGTTALVPPAAAAGGEEEGGGNVVAISSAVAGGAVLAAGGGALAYTQVGSGGQPTAVDVMEAPDDMDTADVEKDQHTNIGVNDFVV